MDIVDNPLPGGIIVYLEAFESGLRFPLSKIVTKILQMYDSAVAQLVPNVRASILLLIATCKLKRL